MGNFLLTLATFIGVYVTYRVGAGMGAADDKIAVGLAGIALPRGRITEIFGPATSGKVTMAAKTLSAAHGEREVLAAWLDLPITCAPGYLHRCGLDRLLVVHPRDAADARLRREAKHAITLHLVESNTLAALVFDGTADMAQTDPATVTGSLERLTTPVTQTHSAVLFLTERASASSKPGAQSQTLVHVAAVRLAQSQKLPLTHLSCSPRPRSPPPFPTLEVLRSITQYATLSD